MQKVKIFKEDGLYKLEEEINRFISNREIEVINVSLSTIKYDYNASYCAIVCFKQK